MLHCLRTRLGDRKDTGVEITICVSPSLIKGSLTNGITLHLFISPPLQEPLSMLPFTEGPRQFWEVGVAVPILQKRNWGPEKLNSFQNLRDLLLNVWLLVMLSVRGCSFYRDWRDPPTCSLFAFTKWNDRSVTHLGPWESLIFKRLPIALPGVWILCLRCSLMSLHTPSNTHTILTQVNK